MKHISTYIYVIYEPTWKSQPIHISLVTQTVITYYIEVYKYPPCNLM